jgi:hypothetical protein
MTSEVHTRPSAAGRRPRKAPRNNVTCVRSLSEAALQRRVLHLGQYGLSSALSELPSAAFSRHTARMKGHTDEGITIGSKRPLGASIARLRQISCFEKKCGTPETRSCAPSEDPLRTPLSRPFPLGLSTAFDVALQLGLPHLKNCLTSNGRA